MVSAGRIIHVTGVWFTLWSGWEHPKLHLNYKGIPGMHTPKWVAMNFIKMPCVLFCGKSKHSLVVCLLYYNTYLVQVSMHAKYNILYRDLRTRIQRYTSYHFHQPHPQAQISKKVCHVVSILNSCHSSFAACLDQQLPQLLQSLQPIYRSPSASHGFLYSTITKHN